MWNLITEVIMVIVISANIVITSKFTKNKREWNLHRNEELSKAYTDGYAAGVEANKLE